MWRRFKKILCCKERGGGEDTPPDPATPGAARTPKSPDDGSRASPEKERALSWN